MTSELFKHANASAPGTGPEKLAELSMRADELDKASLFTIRPHLLLLVEAGRGHQK